LAYLFVDTANDVSCVGFGMN